MATVEAARPLRGRQQRARRVRLQAGARPLAGELLVVRRRVQLHLDPDRRHPAVRVRVPVRGPGGVVDVADRARRPDDGRAVLRRDGRPVSARGIGLQLVQARRRRLLVLDDRLDLRGRLDRHRRRRRGRLAGGAAAGLAEDLPDPRQHGRRRLLLHQGRRPQRAAARRDPGRVRDDRQHARRQDHGPDQQLRRDGRADRRLDPGDPDPVQRPPRARASCSTTSASARATAGATSARSSSAGS